MSNDEMILRQNWWQQGTSQGDQYLLILNDHLNGQNSPIFVPSDVDVIEVIRSYRREQEDRQEEIIACYDLSRAMGPQLATESAWFM